MKKLAILLCALCVITGSAYAGETTDVKKCPHHKQPPTKEEMVKIHKAREAAFEQKLNLTEEQKVKAKELRQQGFEKMKPLMDDMRAKKQEIKNVKQADMTAEAQEARLNELNNEIRDLRKQTSQIRKQNMKDFEAILTKDQKKVLKNMKQEGRKKFEHERRLNPPPTRRF